MPSGNSSSPVPSANNIFYRETETLQIAKTASDSVMGCFFAAFLISILT